MKRSITGLSMENSSKKVKSLVSYAVSKKSSYFTLDNMPNHHFHLDGNVFAVVSVFRRSLKVHLRIYSSTKDGSFWPTANGLTMAPLLFEEFVKSTQSIGNMDENLFIGVAKQMVIFTSLFENELKVHIQLINLSNGRICVNPYGVTLTMYQWTQLKAQLTQVRASLHELMFDDLLRQHIQDAIKIFDAKDQVVDETEIAPLDILKDELVNCIQSNVKIVQDCPGCKKNTLGNHTCFFMTSSYEMCEYFLKALAMVDIKHLAWCVVRRNGHRLGNVVRDIFSRMDIEDMLKSAKDICQDRMYM